MAEKIVVQLDLENGEVKGAVAALEKAGAQAGQKAGVKFSKSFDSSVSSSIARLGSSIAKATSLVGGLASAYLGFKAIDAAQVQEDAVNNLNNALATAGDFSLQASKSMQEFASQLQQTTRFGDEVILNQLALAKSFGATNDQAKEIVSAATNLASAFGIDLQSATRNISKTLGGLTGELGEVIPQLKSLTTEQLKAGGAIEFLSDRFAGAAQRDVKTYSGAIDQLKNSFGDTLEAIGRIITSNPQFISIINKASQFFGKLTSEIDKFASTFNLFQTLTDNLIPFNEAIIKYVIPPLELLANVANVVQLQLQSYFANIVSGVGNVGFAIAKLLDALGIGEKFSNELKTFEQSSEETANQIEQNLVKAIGSIGEFPLAESLSQKNEELKQFFQEQNTIAQEAASTRSELLNVQRQEAEVAALTLTDTFKKVYEGLTSGIDIAANKTADANKRISEFAMKAGKSLQQGFGQAAGQAFASFGAAIAKGNASLKSFADAFLKQIGQSAIQLGTNFILEGTAYTFSANPALQALGPGLIASGAALATFGGALSAISGGGGAAGGGGGTGAGPAGTFGGQTDDLASPTLERAAPSTNVNLTVEGSLVRQEELGDFITRTLNESFSKQGVTLTDARLRV